MSLKYVLIDFVPQALRTVKWAEFEVNSKIYILLNV